MPTRKATTQPRWEKRIPSERRGWRTDSVGSCEVIECWATHDQLKATAVASASTSPTTSDAWGKSRIRVGLAVVDFELSGEQRLLQETVRAFVDERVLPVAIQNDIDHHLDRELIDGMAELG